MTTWFRLALIATACTSAGTAVAASNTGYRCTDANGAVSFQDKPCRGDQQSHAFEYQRNPPPAPEETAAEETASAAADEATKPARPARPEPPATPAPPPPRPPVPIVFRCVRADNDKVYYSETGATPSYHVPAGVVGLPGGSLRDNAQPSAPELNRPPVSDGSGENAVAAAYVEVRDRCEQLVPAEACRALRSQLDDNLARQRAATRNERAGLAGEARTLADKLAGC
ncbi:MAG: DUF4124 domain-containing protein [Rhodanobacteraceae bacterium]|nr:DUF4124 domain-containing protein [Rhodanobacteraceae bacterium]